MKEEKIKMTIKRMFQDGELLDQETAPEITTESLFFPENAKVARVSVSRDLPFQIYNYGNAKAGCHISVPCYLDKMELQEAIKYATKLAVEFQKGQTESYLKYLEAKGIDWQKIDSALKAGK